MIKKTIKSSKTITDNIMKNNVLNCKVIHPLAELIKYYEQEFENIPGVLKRKPERKIGDYFEIEINNDKNQMEK